MADQFRIQSFRDLNVWQEAMDLAVDCYALTAVFPKSEIYGLTSQARRAAVSIPSNIAEGHARPTSVYRNHVSIGLGSQGELDTLLELAVRLRYLTTNDINAFQRSAGPRRPNAASPGRCTRSQTARHQDGAIAPVPIGDSAVHESAFRAAPNPQTAPAPSPQSRVPSRSPRRFPRTRSTAARAVSGAANVASRHSTRASSRRGDPARNPAGTVRRAAGW